jgi:hypothetical protein
MSFVNRAMMRTVVHHVLNKGIDGIEEHRSDVVQILSEMTNEQLSIHLYALEQSMWLTQIELEKRNM